MRQAKGCTVPQTVPQGPLVRGDDKFVANVWPYVPHPALPESVQDALPPHIHQFRVLGCMGGAGVAEEAEMDIDQCDSMTLSRINAAC